MCCVSVWVFVDCVNEHGQRELALCCWFPFSISWGLLAFHVKPFCPGAQRVFTPQAAETLSAAAFLGFGETRGRRSDACVLQGVCVV